MEESLKFNSQVCTTKIQSQRLLDLGLKPETADMCWFNDMQKPFCAPYKCFVDRAQDMKWIILPAWSLHRLIELFTNSVTNESDAYILNTDNTFDAVIDDIEWCINKGYFNEEYLKQCQTKENTEHT